MKSSTKAFLIIVSILTVVLFVTIYLTRLGFFTWGKRAEMPLSLQELSIIEKYKKIYESSDVRAVHDFESIKSKRGNGVFRFYIATEDSIFSFKSLPSDSVVRLGYRINQDIQNILTNKPLYDSVQISLYTDYHLKNSTITHAVFTKNFSYPIQK